MGEEGWGERGETEAWGEKVREEMDWEGKGWVAGGEAEEVEGWGTKEEGKEVS